MSHPFTPEYMQEGETSSTQIKRESQEGSAGHKSQTESRPSTRISENQSVIDICETDSDGESALEEIRQEMNITIQENEVVSFFKIARMAMRRRMKMFAEEVSIVGLSYLVKPSSNEVASIIRKIIWTLLLLFGSGFMVYQIQDRISYYLTYPTIVNYQVAYNRSLRFPTVTICAEFIFSKERLSSFVSGPEINRLVSTKYPPFWDLEFGESFKVDNLTNLDFDWDYFFNKISFHMEDLMLECSFGNLPCNSNDAIEKILTDQGYCLSFNPVTANYVTNQPGANNGLRLVLWMNQSDCFLNISPAVGFRVVLHDPHDKPVIQEIGFRVGTGVSTSVSFSLKNLSMLPSPYGDCRPTANYTFMKCTWRCITNFTVSECNCRPYFFDVAAKLCSIDQLYSCWMKSMKRLIYSGAYRNCGCPLQCYLHVPSYPFSVSSSPLSQHFLNYMSQKSQFKRRNLTMSKLSKELVYLDIFYSQLSYIDIQTYPAYDFLTLVCDISGALGLILGGTLLTIVEFSQFFIQVLDELVTSARFAQMQRR